MSTPGRQSRLRLLEAAVDLLAEEGLQALSHRSIEKRAGAAHGSTTYHFKTRDALLVALVDHLAAKDGQLVQEALYGRDVDAVAADLALSGEVNQQILDFLLGSRRESLARFELFLYAARRPELQETVAQWRGHFAKLVEPVLARLGSADPAAGARWFLAALDGFLLHQLTGPDAALAETAPYRLRLLLDAAATRLPEGAAEPEPGGRIAPG